MHADQSSTVQVMPGGATLRYHELLLQPGPANISEQVLRRGNPAQLGTLASLCRDLFVEHYGTIEFGPVIAGAIFELRLREAPQAIYVEDGYLNLHLPYSMGHLHLGIAPSAANAAVDASGATERERRCARAALFEGVAPGGARAVRWGARLWNGAGTQMITFFFEPPGGALIFRTLLERYAGGTENTIRPSEST